MLLTSWGHWISVGERLDRYTSAIWIVVTRRCNTPAKTDREKIAEVLANRQLGAMPYIYVHVCKWWPMSVVVVAFEGMYIYHVGVNNNNITNSVWSDQPLTSVNNIVNQEFSYFEVYMYNNLELSTKFSIGLNFFVILVAIVVAGCVKCLTSSRKD